MLTAAGFSANNATVKGNSFRWKGLNKGNPKMGMLRANQKEDCHLGVFWPAQPAFECPAYLFLMACSTGPLKKRSNPNQKGHLFLGRSTWLCWRCCWEIILIHAAFSHMSFSMEKCQTPYAPVWGCPFRYGLALGSGFPTDLLPDAYCMYQQVWDAGCMNGTQAGLMLLLLMDSWQVTIGSHRTLK